MMGRKIRRHKAGWLDLKSIAAQVSDSDAGETRYGELACALQIDFAGRKRGNGATWYTFSSLGIQSWEHRRCTSAVVRKCCVAER
jgi:hypothetical protein